MPRAKMRHVGIDWKLKQNRWGRNNVLLGAAACGAAALMAWLARGVQ